MTTSSGLLSSFDGRYRLVVPEAGNSSVCQAAALPHPGDAGREYRVHGGGARATTGRSRRRVWRTPCAGALSPIESTVARSGIRSGGRPGLQNRCSAVVPSRVGSIPTPLRHSICRKSLRSEARSRWPGFGASRAFGTILARRRVGTRCRNLRVSEFRNAGGGPLRFLPNVRQSSSARGSCGCNCRSGPPRSDVLHQRLHRRPDSYPERTLERDFSKSR
jgi:hypothetical protein